jgi:cofilin
VVVDETSAETDYEVFVEKLTSARDSAGRRAPRYAVYDVKYDLKDDGQRCA